MLIPIDEVAHFDITLHHPSTGAVTDADSGPSYDVFEEATDTPILDDQTLTKRTSLTGNYRGSFTASAANGFEAGKWYSVIASATVNSIVAKAVALHFRVAPAESSAGVPKSDVSHFGGAAGTFASGRAEANATHWAGTAVGSANVLIDGAITAAKVATDAIDADALADGAITAATFAAGAIDAAAIAADAIGSSELAASAITEIQSGLSTLTTAQVNTEVDTALADVGVTTTVTGRIDAAVSTRASQTSLDTVDDFLDTEAAAIKAKTDQLTFTVANTLDANVSAVNGSATGVDKLAAHLPAILRVVTTSGGSTTTVPLNATTGIDGAAPSSVNDFYNGRVIVFTSGALAGQATDITDYDGATKILTVTALTAGPASGVLAVMV